MKKTIPVVLCLTCLVFAAYDLYNHHHKQPLVDDYGQELTPIADVGIETTFLDLFDNCVLPNGEPCTLESMDPYGTRRNIPSCKSVKPTFPLLLTIHGTKQMDILYDIFLVRGNDTPNDESIHDVDKPYVIITKNCCPLCPEEKFDVRCNTRWCYFVADSVDYPGKYRLYVNPFFGRQYTEKNIVKDDILQYAFLFPVGVTMDNLRKIILEVSYTDSEDKESSVYISIDKEDLEIRDDYEKTPWDESHQAKSRFVPQ